MKKTLIISLIILCALLGTAMGSEIGNLTWNESNIQTLRSFDKEAVVKFLNEWTGMDGKLGALTPQQVDEFKWIDLAGDGKYELVLTASSGPCCEAVGILTQTRAGKLRVQNFLGAGRLSKMVRDLNGDGKDELILYSYIGSAAYNGTTPEPVWPQVYRLKHGKYVEASHDFPDFYDHEVLPELDKQIKHHQSVRGAGNRDLAATLIMQRDKILRVLGRDPTAGLRQAYQWLNSDDPQLLGDAMITFQDIGGHDEEMREARDKIGPAFKHEIESRKGG
jgi:hypothetical protein